MNTTLPNDMAVFINDEFKRIMDARGTPQSEDNVEPITAEQTAGRKFDGGKIRMELIPPELKIAIGSVLTFGAEKYTTWSENEWDALLLVPSVKSVKVTTAKGNVVDVTRDTSETVIPSMQNANVKIDEIGKPETLIECVSWQSLERKIHTLVNETSEPNGSTPLNDTVSQKHSMKMNAQKGAPFVEQQNTCTLTIVTTQGNFEESFVPSAITDSAFWATMWKGLKEHFGISRPQNKTGVRNWEAGMDWSRVYGALDRHLTAWWGGEEADPETGKSHLWHAGCCITFLIAYEMRGSGNDDRPHTFEFIERM